MAKYNKAMVNRICAYIESDDYTTAEICELCGITYETFRNWRENKPAFSAAIKKADEKRLDSFKRAARSGLMTLLKGKEWEEVTTEWVDSKETDAEGRPKPKLKSQRKVKKFIMPNPVNVIFTLKSLDPDNFKDLIKTELTGKNGGPIESKAVEPEIDYTQLSDAALNEIVNARKGKAED